VDPSTTVAQAATVMAERHVGSALVMEGSDLAGIFTERDIVRALSQDFDAPGHPFQPLDDREPDHGEPDAQVDDALERSARRGLSTSSRGRRLRRDRIVSMADVSRAAVED
jgi:CBS domain-containing protein